MADLSHSEEVRAIAITAASRSVRSVVGASATEDTDEILERAKDYENYILYGR